MKYRILLPPGITSMIPRFCPAIGMLAVLALSTAGANEIPTTAPEKEGFSSQRLARLDAKTHSYVDQCLTAGVITLIARHGSIVHFDVYGKSDIDSGTRMKADSLFRTIAGRPYADFERKEEQP